MSKMKEYLLNQYEQENKNTSRKWSNCMDINVMNIENKCNCVKHECNNKDDYTKDGHTCEECFMDCVKIMTTYEFRVEQEITPEIDDIIKMKEEGEEEK